MRPRLPRPAPGPGLPARPGPIWRSGRARLGRARPRTTWCLTVTDADRHAIGHGCAPPQRKRGRSGTSDDRDPPGFTFTPVDAEGPPGGYGTWRLATGIRGQRALRIEIDPIAIGTCDHRFEARGHHPGIKLRHLAPVRHAACTAPMCRRPAATCDFEHNTPYENGGRTCLCNGGPLCKR